MNLHIIILSLFIVTTICLILVILSKQKKVKELSGKLNNTIKLIEDRLGLADKYSKMLSSVVDHTFEAVIITDKDGHIEWVNSGFTKITGYNFMEVKGKKPGDVLQGPQTDKETVSRIRKKLLEKTTFKDEILNYHKEGRTYWLSLSITPILDVNGNIEKFIAIESDITEQKNQIKSLEDKLKLTKTSTR